MLLTLLLGSKIGIWNCQNCMSMNFFSYAVQILKESLIRNKQIFLQQKVCIGNRDKTTILAVILKPVKIQKCCVYKSVCFLMALILYATWHTSLF